MELVGYTVLAILVENETRVLLRARADADGSVVVIKLLKAEHPAPAEVARLQHEYAMARDLEGRGFVRPVGVVRFDRRVGLVLADVGGSSLSAALAAPDLVGAGLDIIDFLRLACSLAEEIGRLHEASVMHRDVKPANVIVHQMRCRLIDLGLATRLESSRGGDVSDFAFEDRRVQIYSAYSGSEARRVIAEHPDTAVILLDVIMETDGAGLDFARFVRSELENTLVRIILRTGQPGAAPERRVIVDYDTLSMQTVVDALNERRSKSGDDPLRIGIGVHAGPVVLGVIGEEFRLEGTVIADSVNLASRLQGLCKEFGIRIVATADCLQSSGRPDGYATRYLGTLALRGKAERVDAYELFDCDPDATREGKLATRGGLERGLRCLAAGELEESARALRAVVEVIPDDPVALDYLAQATLARRARLLGHETLTPRMG